MKSPTGTPPGNPRSGYGYRASHRMKTSPCTGAIPMPAYLPTPTMVPFGTGTLGFITSKAPLEAQWIRAPCPITCPESMLLCWRASGLSGAAYSSTKCSQQWIYVLCHQLRHKSTRRHLFLVGQNLQWGRTWTDFWGLEYNSDSGTKLRLQPAATGDCTVVRYARTGQAEETGDCWSLFHRYRTMV